MKTPPRPTGAPPEPIVAPTQNETAPTAPAESPAPSATVTPVQPPVPSGAPPPAPPAAKVSAPAPAAKSERVGTLHDIKGEVVVRRPGGQWEPARDGMRVGRNWNIQSRGGDSAFDLDFVDKTKIAMRGDGLVVTYGRSRSSARVQPGKVELDEGEVKRGLAALRGAPPLPAPKDVPNS